MSYTMLNRYSYAIKTILASFALLVALLLVNPATAATIEYKARLFGEGMQLHNCIDLDSRGTVFADYDEEQGTLTNIQGALKFVTITEGFIKSGFNNLKNYVLGTFNEHAPEFLRDKNIFVDLSRGAEYEETLVNERRVREWGWAFFYNPGDYADADALFADRDNLKTIFDPSKTFAELCPQYANGNSAGHHGWCGAGVEFFTNKGTPAPIPVPAAFYLLATGVIGLVSFSRKKRSVHNKIS